MSFHDGDPIPKGAYRLLEKAIGLLKTPLLIFLTIMVVLLLIAISMLNGEENYVLVFSIIVSVVVIFAVLAVMLEFVRMKYELTKDRLRYEERTVEALKVVVRETVNELEHTKRRKSRSVKS